MGVDIERLKVDAAYWDEVAPDGAQWFGPGGDGYKEGWYRMMPGEGLCFLEPVDGVWTPIPGSLRGGAIPRPATQSPEWDGTGLPPVGCECEFKYVGIPWDARVCQVLGIHEESNRIWLHMDGNDESNIYKIDSLSFRPIRTPEQRLREELESVIRYWLKGGENEEVIARALLAKYNLTEK